MLRQFETQLGLNPKRVQADRYGWRATRLRALIMMIASSMLASGQPLSDPQWFELVPGPSGGAAIASREQSHTYTDRSSAAVLTHYQETLSQAGITFWVGFNGIGPTIYASTEAENCVIRLSENDGVVSTQGSCGPKPQTAAVLLEPKPAGLSSPGERSVVTYVPAQPAAAAAVRQDLPGVHRVEYSLDGSAGVAGLTLRNASGGTEQREVKIPGALGFYARSGQFVYFSAQNKSGKGTVHVRIQIDGQVLQEATTTSPYGIATASGRVP